ncbi:MAG TPA: WYL domain-containing protein [Candidatus Acidoferrum sp.]|nr:WYL domain-containing protein [Candidatus Acidoferrum sp.]
MQSQRLVSCLLLLQGERRQTARQLAEALEVSTRTVYRDVEALSAAGIPVHMERGPHGGVVLADDYRRALAQFTSDELQALFAVSSEPIADLGIASHTHALRKLAGALPESQRRAAERARGRLLLDHNRWYRGHQPVDVLAALQEAIAEERRVRLRYRDRNGSASERLVDPLGLVAKAGVWYLVAREPEKGYRTFRVQRVVEVEPTNGHFARPADFDLDAHWRSAVASIERQSAEPYVVTLRVAANALSRIVPYWDVAVIEEEPTYNTLRIAFPMRDVAVFQVLALGEAATIIEPPDLMDALLACARQVLAGYATPARG